MDLYFLGVGYWKFIVLCWWCHVSLMLSDHYSLV